MFYELRTGPDDLPYAKTYGTLAAATKAAFAKARKLGHEVLVYRMSEQGEFYMGCAD
jgi:hypothetical protein